MKMYIVHSDKIKVFTDKQALIKYLGKEKSKTINRIGKTPYPKLDDVKISEVEIIEETTASQYLETALSLQTPPEGDLANKLEALKSMFIKFAKEDPQKQKFLNQLETTPIEKKSLSKLITKWTGYLLSVNESIPWYKAILDIHNFKKIENSYVREIFYSDGSSRYQNVKVNDTAKELFNLAKSK